MSPESIGESEKKVRISDDIDAIPIKGMSFTVTPETDEQEIASWIALSKKDIDFLPRIQELWRLYSKRHELTLTTSQISAMAKFCLLLGIPAFFWIKDFNADELKEILLATIVSKSALNEKATIVQTGAFLGKSFKKTLIRKMGKAAERLAFRTRKGVELDPRELFSPKLIEPSSIGLKGSESSFQDLLEKEATKLTIVLSNYRGGYMERQKAFAIDCYLYARDDKYLYSGRAKD